MTDSATFTTPEASDEDLGDLLLDVLPPDGSTFGNMSAREALGRAAGRQISEEEYEAVRDKALALGLVVKGWLTDTSQPRDSCDCQQRRVIGG